MASLRWDHSTFFGVPLLEKGARVRVLPSFPSTVRPIVLQKATASSSEIALNARKTRVLVKRRCCYRMRGQAVDDAWFLFLLLMIPQAHRKLCLIDMFLHIPSGYRMRVGFQQVVAEP